MRFPFRAALFAIVAAACVTEPSAPASATYSYVPDGLWTVSGSSSSIIRLDVASLIGTGDLLPASVVTTPSARLFTLAAVAFDASGTLWIASADDSLLLAFGQETLASAGFRPARHVIPSVAGSLSGPGGLAFDRAQRLWVANHENGTLVRYDQDQLSAGGPQRPAVVITGAGHPTGLAFDAAGMLWVSDNTAHTIAGYSATQLDSSGKHKPAVVLSSNGSLLNPTGLAFDEAGNLWVANLASRSVVAFTPEQLRCSGAPAPSRLLAPSVRTLNLPAGLAFDAAANLWVIGATGTLTKFEQADLATSRSPEPSAHFRVSGASLLWSAAFWPKPAGLPLN
jgi:sugar lactone lactonase YvrE